MCRSILARGGVFVVLACGLAAGCGSGTNRVSGKVTFKGQPVPAGKIYFIPDGAKGNSGATGYANIVNGEYDTSAAGGMGAIKGPMIVAIEGFDPAAKGKTEKGDTSGEETVKALFPRYETSYDVPGSTSTKDFDVPAEAAKPKQGPTIIIP
jgi:hypothetical protein